MILEDVSRENFNCTYRKMEYSNKETSFKISPLFVLFLVLAMALCSSLVCMRMYGLTLESELEKLTSITNELKAQVTSVQKRCLAMESPSAVYGYASKKLGMTEEAFAGIIKVQSSGRTASSGISDPERWSGSLPNRPR